MQIVDCFLVTPIHLARYADQTDYLAQGLWFVIDPPLNNSSYAPTIGLYATITRPDGSAITVKIIGVEVRHTILALQFEGIDKEDIPRTSNLIWASERESRC